MPIPGLRISVSCVLNARTRVYVFIRGSVSVCILSVEKAVRQQNGHNVDIRESQK